MDEFLKQQIDYKTCFLCRFTNNLTELDLSSFSFVVK